ncbi:hypothetical protein B0T26DRAFT_868585 [Lasiosphaeria miniovina]|uniref:Uncharacterized protein n=1 Tax=Lasiosphaeria miniovina TaxID=1954250 RepID=A0AA40B444_9PEZI|nr:uncharacterized protein B0T26DRAFT_868585 [Lasiosphaeria miniovina]KAK0727239.1 hypothetical protein B0T26DRAFT_868585 [Lasiosphaeria miniovina]
MGCWVCYDMMGGKPRGVSRGDSVRDRGDIKTLMANNNILIFLVTMMWFWGMNV